MASEQTVVCEPTAWMKEKRAGMSFEARADDVTRDGADHDSLLRHSIELQPKAPAASAPNPPSGRT